MKTILVPVDFTATSDNAVHFAAAWSKKYEYGRIILFKTFYESMFEYLAVAADYTIVNSENLNAQREDAMQELQQLRNNLKEKLGDDVIVTIAVSESPLLRGIFEILQSDTAPDLIILGSDHTGSGNSFISANIISIAKTSPVNVLIVPSDYTYRPVKNVLVPCDIYSLNALDKLSRVKNSPRLEGTQLLVLNVSVKGFPGTENSEREEDLHNYLKEFPHEIYHASDKNVIDGILSFTRDHEVELIITLPGKHSFLYSLTNKSISEAIYRNVHQPVLILK